MYPQPLPLSLWQVTRDPSILALAIDAAIKAVEVDGTWPWPEQLAEESHYSRMPTDRRRFAPCWRPISRRVFFEWFDLAITPNCSETGCRLAIRSEEFARSEFGSRQPVYVLDDPHRLLKSTIVFKEANRADAAREIAALDGPVIWWRSGLRPTSNCPNHF